MYIIKNVTADANQSQRVLLEDGSYFDFELQFKPMQYGWFITDLTYVNTNFELQGFRVCTSPNILYQFKNQIPFGIAVALPPDNQEPMLARRFCVRLRYSLLAYAG